MNIYALVVDDEAHNDPFKRTMQRLREAIVSQGHEFAFVATSNIPNGAEKLKEDQGFDVVLLDYIGLLDKVSSDERSKKIQTLHNARPYIPIIMLSQSYESNTIMNCLDAGAVSFINKKSIKIGVTRSEQKNLEQISQRILKAVAYYKPIKDVLYEKRIVGVVRKESRCRQPSVNITWQIEILRRFEQIGTLKNHFPNVTHEEAGVDLSKPFAYEMPMYGWPTLRRFIFSAREGQTAECSAKCDAVVRQVLGLLKEVAKLDRSAEKSDRYLSEWCIQRVKDSWNAAGSVKAAEQDAEDVELLKKLVDGKATIVIDGSEYHSPRMILDHLNEDDTFKGEARPAELCRVHGDLHFGNILTRADFPEAVDFVLIDPLPFQFTSKAGVLDRAWDVGKLLCSCHGLYDMFVNSYLQYTAKKDSGATIEFIGTEPEWILETCNEGASGDTVVTFVRSKSYHKEVFNKLHEVVKKVVTNEDWLEGDQGLMLRSYFAEAISMCKLSKERIQENASQSLSLFVRGIKLMGDFYKRYQEGGQKAFTNVSQ
jgi:CheY-like chemotaxis protein